MKQISDNLVVLVARVLVKYIPYLSCLSSAVVRINTDEMAKKSQVVFLIVCLSSQCHVTLVLMFFT